MKGGKEGKEPSLPSSNSNRNINLIIANHIIKHHVAKNKDHLKGSEMVKWACVGSALEFSTESTESDHTKE